MPPITATIFNIQKFSTEDGPGIRTTVFFKGCPMRCAWCHNPESQRFRPEVVWHGGRCLADRGCLEACETNALRADDEGIHIDRELCEGCAQCVAFCPSSALEIHGRTIEIDELFDMVQRDAQFYTSSGGGVTLSGGEPLSQPEATLALLKRLHDEGIHAALDTCAAAPEAVVAKALPYCDLVLLDIKCADPERHRRITGIAFEQVAKAAELVGESGVAVWVRTPVIPGYTDGEESIRQVARFVAENLPNCERHDLLAFSNLCASKYEQLGRPFALAGTPLLTSETMTHLCDVARGAGSAAVHWSGPIHTAETGI